MQGRALHLHPHKAQSTGLVFPMAGPDAVEQQVAAEHNVDIIPGTEVMTDVGDAHFAKAGGKANGSV